MDPRNVPDSRDMGRDPKASDYDPKTVRGVPGAESSEDGNYESQDDVREWDTQGEFGPSDDVFGVFSEVMDSPAEELEDDQRVMTDGGVPNGSPFYREEDEESLYSGENERPMTDGGQPTMSEVDHEGPYGDFDEGGAPW